MTEGEVADFFIEIPPVAKQNVIPNYFISIKLPSASFLKILERQNLITRWEIRDANTQFDSFLADLTSQSTVVILSDKSRSQRMILPPLFAIQKGCKQLSEESREAITFEAIALLEQHLSSRSLNHIDYYFSLRVLSNVFGDPASEQLFSNLISASHFTHHIAHQTQSLYGDVTNWHQFSVRQHVDALIDAFEHGQEPNSKLRKKLIRRLTPFIDTVPLDSPKRKHFRVAHWSLDTFITPEHLYLKQQQGVNFAFKIDPASAKKQAQIARAIEKIDPDFLVFHEVHAESIKEFVQKYFHSKYKIITTPSTQHSQLFSSAIIYKSDLPIHIRLTSYKGDGDYQFTHGFYGAEIYESPGHRPETTSNILALIFFTHLKSLRPSASSDIQQSKRWNSLEMAMARKIIHKTQYDNPSLPIIFMADINNDLSNDNVRAQVLGKAFLPIRDMANGATSTTQFGFDRNESPRDSEIDIIAGNPTARKYVSHNKVKRTDFYASLAYDNKGFFRPPETKQDRDENFPSDHMLIFTTFSTQLLRARE